MSCDSYVQCSWEKKIEIKEYLTSNSLLPGIYFTLVSSRLILLEFPAVCPIKNQSLSHFPSSVMHRKIIK